MIHWLYKMAILASEEFGVALGHDFGIDKNSFLSHQICGSRSISLQICVS
jgi:hypothetical protein